MYKAIRADAPVAALVYGLALVGAMSGFYWTDGDRRRYEKFVEDYMSNSHSGYDYRQLDLYKSLRCDMIRGLIPGRLRKAKHSFQLVHADDQELRDLHGKPAQGGRILFHVEVFCSDALAAARTFLDDVEQAMSMTPEVPLLSNFKARMDREGYSIMLSR
jgi:hypothetical protein